MIFVMFIVFVPSRLRGVDQSQSQRQGQVNMWWDHTKDPKKGSQQSDYIRRRQDKGVAKKGRRLNNASPRKGVA